MLSWVRPMSFPASRCMMPVNYQVYSNLMLYSTSRLGYYGKWNDGVQHCVGYELSVVQIAMMQNDELQTK